MLQLLSGVTYMGSPYYAVAQFFGFVSIGVGILAALLPWIIRGSLWQLHGHVAGSNGFETFAFIAMTLVDLIAQTSPYTHSGLLGMSPF
jgi:hypothetical protein